jgi:hypothetical protein
MTRTGPMKRVEDGFWKGRLDNARAFRDAAHLAATFAEPGQNANPLVSHIVTAAIAYADAVTAQARQVVNQQDHQAVARALRAALGNALPVAQERRVARILSEKDQAQYSARRGVLTHALELLQELDGFATWVEEHLRA